ncbi:hypothetical protein PENARI_c024G01601 [Penicillium arizonense]|uniref:Ubiquitin carboxyl-terminal hydrolase n=1 Tax=Penicillium arizonense TaxID=1835702 RepID=A0A1F5L6X7_PENAI|nr:hypothetical protein PENARI_c024G01601 [Penicillium arizonense]OGE48988.1 hypothetical protein PENARI_c024G01601 [Penicillium arizonense]
MAHPGVQVIDGRKTFIPLAPDMLSHIPRPVSALILLADTPIYIATRSAVEPTIPLYTGSGPDEPILWMKQTIGHACGLMAVLHVVLNLDSGKHVTGSELHALVKKAVELEPTERAELLYQSKFLEEAHMDAASQGCSIVPSPRDDCGFHFVAFVQKDRKVWELNGGMNGPLLRGELEGDLLSEKGLEMTVNGFLQAAENVDHRGISIVAVSG